MIGGQKSGWIFHLWTMKEYNQYSYLMLRWFKELHMHAIRINHYNNPIRQWLPNLLAPWPTFKNTLFRLTYVYIR